MATNDIYGDIGQGFDVQQVKPQGVYERGRQVAAGDPIDYFPASYLTTDFTGSGSLVWTVLPKHITTLAYDLDGSRLTVAIELLSFSVSGTGNVLRWQIPGGYFASRRVSARARIVDNGTVVQGIARVRADTPYIEFIRDDVANYTASADNSSIQAQIAFWVKSQAV